VVDFGLQLKKSIAETAKGVSVVPSMVKLIENSSSSQHKTWNRCKRLWWATKVAGLRERQKQHFVIGHALHAVAELYITGQTTSWEGLFPPGWDKGLDDHERLWIRGSAEKAVAKGVWQAIPDSMIEFPICFLVGDEHVDARGLPLLARAETYKDAQGVRRVARPVSLYDGSPLPAGWDRLPPYVGFIDHLILWESPPTIADHKTAKNRSYATTPGKLAEDEQVLSYSAVPMVLRPDVDLVKLRHNVFLKNDGAPDPYVVAAVAPLEKVQQVWKEIRFNSAAMQQVRQAAPRINDPANPYRRADNWQKVKGAIEEARPQACKEYGGCMLKDLCQGRCTAEQIVRRLDSPDPLDLVKRDAPPAVEQKFGLNIKSTPSHHPATSTASIQRTPMPFPGAKPAPLLALNQDVYVLDPEDVNIQLRARVLELNADGAARIALYPNPDVQPDFASLGVAYLPPDFMPRDKVLTIPHPTAKIHNYQELCQAAGFDAVSIAWSPAPVASTPNIAATAKPVAKPDRDGAFGLKGVTTAAASVAAPTATAVPVVPFTPPFDPKWAQSLKEGESVLVRQSEHKFWGPLAGKLATITGIAPGEPEGSVMLTVTIEGHPYPDVMASRFEPSSPAVAEEGDPSLARAKALIGKHVGVVLHSTSALTNCILEAVDATGITILGGKHKLWSDVKSLDPMGQIPGAQPSKEAKAAAREEAKEQKQAAKDAEKAAKAAAKEAAKAGTQTALAGTNPPPQVNPAGALDSALEAVQAVLTGGKVTRKALEGILPLLQSAKQHQTNLESSGGQISGPPKAPPLFKPSEIGKVVDEAKALVSRASDMLAKVIEF
jgi:hypothetical protein